jgi:preprotein translocase subunit SecB
MADEKPAATKDAQTNAPSFGLQRAYLKDLSLEVPNAPHIFLEQTAPNVEVNVGIGAQRLTETMFESTVTVTVTTKIEDKVVYLVEATQGGVFEVANLPDEQIDPLLGIVCPTMLYPYLRANVADAITRTTLPPLHLTEVNFQALYQQRQAEAGKQDQTAVPNGRADSSGAQPGSDAGIILPPGATRQ